MKKRTTIWITLCAALLVAGITVAWTQAQTWRGSHGPFWLNHGPMAFHHGPMGFIARDLDLTDNQKSQIKTIWEGERPNVAELVHELASEQKEMDALTFHDGAPDDAKVQDITTRQGATLAKLLAEKERITGKIYVQVLTPTQRTKADELLKHFGSHLDRIADRIGNGTTHK